jgi:XTP/dITP diphosphohydrolase
LDEMRELMAGLPVDLLTLADLAPIDAPEETGSSFAENARLKATYYAQHTGLLAVGEDSGLEIDALGGAPGVHSARFGGRDRPYPERFALIYERLRRARASGSPARFVCALALADADGVIFEAEGRIEGQVAAEPSGQGGFGYDPIFYYPPFASTLAEAGARKSSVSHRGAAFRALRRYLETGPVAAR